MLEVWPMLTNSIDLNGQLIVHIVVLHTAYEHCPLKQLIKKTHLAKVVHHF